MGESIEERWDKLDDRVKALFKRYWLVGTAVFTAGVVVGGILGVVLS